MSLDISIQGGPILSLSSRKARKDKKALSLGYHGNVVDLWLEITFFIFIFQQF